MSREPDRSDAAACSECGRPLRRSGARSWCPPCEAARDSLQGATHVLPKGLGEAIVPTDVGPVGDAPVLELPPAHWHEVDSSRAIPPVTLADLRLAVLLMERGTSLDCLNTHLLGVSAGLEIDLAWSLASEEAVGTGTLGTARAEIESSTRDPVEWIRDWGCTLFASRGRYVIRGPDVPPRVGPYEILCRLGRGGMGEVLLGFRPGLGKDLAIKCIRWQAGHESRAIGRFQREVQILARLHHAHIVSLVDVGSDGDEAYLAMDFVPGRTLSRRIQLGLTASEPAKILARVARALDYAHRSGITHRDVKALNVLLDAEGQPFLMDFGLASLADETFRLTGTREMFGTPQYMPPEALRGGAKDGVRWDVYSLGVLLYECLTGRLPYEGGSIGALLRQVLSTEPVPPRQIDPKIAPELESLCLRAMSKDPGARPETAGDFAQALEEWVARDPPASRRVRSIPPRTTGRRRTIGISAVVLVGLIGGLLFAWRSGRNEGPSPPHPPPPPPPWVRPEVGGPIPQGAWAEATEISGTFVLRAGGRSKEGQDGNVWSLSAGPEGAMEWKGQAAPCGPFCDALLVALRAERYLLLGGQTQAGKAIEGGWIGDRTNGMWIPQQSDLSLATVPHYAARDEANDRVVMLRREGRALRAYEGRSQADRWSWKPLPGWERALAPQYFQARQDAMRGRIYVLHATVEAGPEHVLLARDATRDDAAAWTPIQVAPGLPPIRRSSFVVRDGLLVIGSSPAKESPWEFAAGRVEGDTLVLHPLPDPGKLQHARLWIDAASGRLILTGSTIGWEEPEEVWTMDLDPLARWLDAQPRE